MPSSWMARAKDRKGNLAVKAHIHRRLVCHAQAKHQRKKQKAGGVVTILLQCPPAACKSILKRPLQA